MADYILQSSWADVDSAAQAHRNNFEVPRSAQMPKTSDMTQAVGIDNSGKLWVRPGSGGGGGDSPVLSVNNQVGDVMLRAEDIPADISGSGWQANNVQDALERINEQSSSAGVTSVNGKVGDVSLTAEDIPAQNSGLGYQDVQDGLTKLELKVNEISSNSVSYVNGKTGIVNLTAEDVEAAPESHMDKHASSTDYGHVMVVDSIASGAGPGVVASSSVVFSHINNSSIHVTSEEKSTWNAKSDFSGNYEDLSGKPTIPTKTSELSNDSGFLTSVPVSSVNGKTGSVNLQAVDIPAQVSGEGWSATNVQEALEHLKDQSGGSSGAVESVNGKTGVVVLTADDVGADEAGSAISVQNNLTTHVNDSTIHVTSLEKSSWNAKSNFSGSYNDLTNKPTIPTKTSDLDNDNGFLTSVPVTSVNGETGAVQLTAQDVGADAAGSASAVQSNLTSHANNSSVHVSSDEKASWNAKSDFSGNYSDLSGKPTIPTKTSQLTNDSGFISSAPVSSVNGKTGAVVLTSEDVGAAPNSHVDKTATDTTPGHVLIDNSLNSGVYVENYVAAGAIPTFRHINNGGIHVTSAEKNAWDAKSDFSGDYNDLLNKPDIPSTASDVGASPKNHRSTGTSYGKGDGTYYGHLKLSSSLTSTSGVSGGIAATPSAIKALYDVIKLIDHGTWTPKCASISSPTQAIGTYIIVNDLCVISFCIYGESSSTSKDSLSLRITGLPFEPDSGVKWFGGGGNVAGVRMNANYAFSGFVIEQNSTYGAFILPRCVQTSTYEGKRSSGYCVNEPGSTMYMAGTIMYHIA